VCKQATFLILSFLILLAAPKRTLAVPTPFSDIIDFAASGTQTVGSDTRTVTTVNDDSPFIYTHSVTFSPPALSIVSATLALTHTHVSVNGELWTVTGGTSTLLGTLSESNGAWTTDTFTIPVSLYPSFIAGSWSLAVKLTESTSGNDTFDLDNSVLSGTYLADAATVTATNVPEPSSMFLLGFGLIGLRVFISYRFNKMKQLPAKAP
jgi:PEP-CTERM motif